MPELCRSAREEKVRREHAQSSQRRTWRGHSGRDWFRVSSALECEARANARVLGCLRSRYRSADGTRWRAQTAQAGMTSSQHPWRHVEERAEAHAPARQPDGCTDDRPRGAPSQDPAHPRRAELDPVDGIPDEYLEAIGTYQMTPEQRVEWGGGRALARPRGHGPRRRDPGPGKADRLRDHAPERCRGADRPARARPARPSTAQRSRVRMFRWQPL